MFQRSLPTHFKKFVHILPGHFPLGSDGVRILWTLTIIIASLGICAFLIYLWRTILASQDKFEEPELRDLRSTKCDQEGPHPSPFPNTSKFSSHVHTHTEEKHPLQTIKRSFLEDKYNTLSSVKTTKEAELKQLRKKVDTLVEFYEQRKVAAEKKLEKTL